MHSFIHSSVRSFNGRKQKQVQSRRICTQVMRTPNRTRGGESTARSPSSQSSSARSCWRLDTNWHTPGGRRRRTTKQDLHYVRAGSRSVGGRTTGAAKLPTDRIYVVLASDVVKYLVDRPQHCNALAARWRTSECTDGARLSAISDCRETALERKRRCSSSSSQLQQRRPYD